MVLEQKIYYQLFNLNQKVWVFTMVCASCTDTKNSTVSDNFVLKEDVYTI